MQFDYSEPMAKASTEELIRIVTVERDNYQEEALFVAERELKRRNVPFELRENFVKKVIIEKELENYKANLPLETSLKMVCFFIPIAGKYIAYGYKNGYTRKRKEIFLYSFYGIAFYILTMIFLFS